MTLSIPLRSHPYHRESKTAAVQFQSSRICEDRVEIVLEQKQAVKDYRLYYRIGLTRMPPRA
jgi:hypothetical protein